MFLPLGTEDLVSLNQIVALVRSGNRTEILLRDRTSVVSGLTPLTLARRSRALWEEGRRERDALMERIRETSHPLSSP